jgi:hypothetical protein
MQRARLSRLTLLGLLAILAVALFAPAAAILEPGFGAVAVVADEDSRDSSFDDGDLVPPAAPTIAFAAAVLEQPPSPAIAGAPSLRAAFRARGPPEA